MLREALPKGATPRLQFSLPDTNLSFDVDADIAWADMKGQAGFRFQNVSRTSQEQLEAWLDQRLEHEFPGMKQQLAAESKSKN
jgi:hypothetical protein